MIRGTTVQVQFVRMKCKTLTRFVLNGRERHFIFDYRTDLDVGFAQLGTMVEKKSISRPLRINLVSDLHYILTNCTWAVVPRIIPRLYTTC